MNLLYTIKELSKRYDLPTSTLYKDEAKTEPITDIEGTTALLTTDGTSWELVDSCWQQIDQDLDMIIQNSIYPFLMSLQNSIENDFPNYCYAKEYESLTFVQNTTSSYLTDIDLGETPVFTVGDFVLIVTCGNKYLTQIMQITDNVISIDNRGLNIRVTGTAEKMGIILVSYPPDFLMAALKMFVFDMFERDDKEKRQERLGNYTYTNFEPTLYYGDGSYPKELQRIIEYWRYIHT